MNWHATTDSGGAWTHADNGTNYCRECACTLILFDDDTHACEEMIRTALDAYIECAMWSSTNDSSDAYDADTGSGPAFDEDYDADDIAPDTRAEMLREITEMMETAHPDTWLYWDAGQFGHDFWLTRNGHGAGYWDRWGTGRGESLGRELTGAAKVYGECHLYVGDDGKVHAS